MRKKVLVFTIALSLLFSVILVAVGGEVTVVDEESFDEEIEKMG